MTGNDGAEKAITESELEARLAAILNSRDERGLLRRLTIHEGIEPVNDFASNDYIGLARSKKLKGLTADFCTCYGGEPNGSTGSRLVTGNSKMAEVVEMTAARIHRAETATLFSNGFAANQGLMGCIGSAEDAILWDELCHASIREGIRTSKVELQLPFKHNHLGDFQVVLEDALKRCSGSVIVLVESLYSMNGDLVPLKRLFNIATKTGGRRVSIIVDEAHSAGLYGENGSGYLCERSMENHPLLLARVVTLGKAFGVQGAFVLGSKVIKSFLLNYARTLIYSTSPSKNSLGAIMASYHMHESEARVRAARARLFALSEYFRTAIAKSDNISADRLIGGETHIHAILVPGADRCLRVATSLRRQGFGVMPVRSPTVAAGSERLRVTIHSYNNAESIDRLVHCLDALLAPSEQQPTSRVARL